MSDGIADPQEMTDEEIRAALARMRQARATGPVLPADDLESELDAAEADRDRWRRRAIAAEADNAALRAIIRDLADLHTRPETVAALQRQIVGHCDRIAAQSDLLSRRAERKDP